MTRVFLDTHGLMQPNGIRDLTRSSHDLVEQVLGTPSLIFCDAYACENGSFVKRTYQVTQPVRDWFRASIPNHWGRVSLEVIRNDKDQVMEWWLRFAEPKHAALFKLAWGGQ